MPDIDIDRYAQTMRVLARAVTTVGANGFRVQNTGSMTVHDVGVFQGANRVTLKIQESGLYVKGFSNANGTYYFKTDPVTVGGTPLKFSCSYIGSNSIGIYVDSDDKVCKEQRSKKQIVDAITALAAFAGGNDLHLKVPLAIMVMLVSESIRFTVVYDRMVEICKGAGVSFSFKEFQKWVQAWEDISTGNLPQGTSQNHLFTRQQ